MLRWGRFAAAYAFIGAISAAIAVIWRDGWPHLHPEPWLNLHGGVMHGYSAAIGATFGALVVVLTRPMVARFDWARALHQELRVVAQGISTSGIVVLAALSAVGEELLFRALLQPWLGLVGQALLFGIVHQVRGKARWAWVTWATLMGLALGALFQSTGSLVGPLVAHAVINGFNLHYLKTHDPAPAPRSLGGLLGQPQLRPKG